MASVADVPHLVSVLARCFAVTGGLDPSPNLVQRMAHATHGILLGLDKVTDWCSVCCGPEPISGLMMSPSMLVLELVLFETRRLTCWMLKSIREAPSISRDRSRYWGVFRSMLRAYANGCFCPGEPPTTGDKACGLLASADTA